MTLTSDSHPYMEVTGNPSANKHPSTTPSAHQVGCPLVGSPFPGTRPAGPSGKVLLAYQSATQHLSSSGLKAGMGLLKMATSQWKHQEKKARVTLSSSSGCRQLNTSGGHPCKKSPLDQLTALVLQGQTRLRELGQGQRRELPCYTKPQNSKRMVVLGAPRVGKTSILRRYLRDGFAEEYEPTSEDFLRKLFHIRGETYQIDVLDASGERSFPAKRRLSILTGDIFLLVFSLDDRSSFEEVCALREEIVVAKTKLLKSVVPGQTARVPMVICANKVDLPPAKRLISRAEVLEVFGETCAYFETSAKDSTNLEDVFETLAKKGGLPTETGPSQHRKVSIRSYQAIRTGGMTDRESQAPGSEIPCGALYPLARRPSFNTDLRKVLGPGLDRKTSRPLEKCQIQ
ncbi:GTP-binding protein Rhes [Hypomesus transpacificus]|uniref:GTP-binding protein Rhes n=1 Tax=Hypomesus transpacificus TaxID=137520 RepID=UPI001F07801F|nr:GTP-binding protein Rhes [Hypomesus transpacificus]